MSTWQSQRVQNSGILEQHQQRGWLGVSSKQEGKDRQEGHCELGRVEYL